MFGHRVDKEIVIFELSSLIELNNPIKSIGKGIQEVKYSSLNNLLSSSYIDEV